MSPETINLANAVMRLTTERKLAAPFSGFIKRLFCRHRPFFWLWNIYGDEILVHDGKRSAWQCCKCGQIIYLDRLMRDLEKEKLKNILNDMSKTMNEAKTKSETRFPNSSEPYDMFEFQRQGYETCYVEEVEPLMEQIKRYKEALRWRDPNDELPDDPLMRCEVVSDDGIFIAWLGEGDGPTYWLLNGPIDSNIGDIKMTNITAWRPAIADNKLLNIQ